MPCWFNGLVPLAYGLGNARLNVQVYAVADTVLGLQTEDRWIGPERFHERIFWARTLFCLGLTQLVEANRTWEVPVLSALRRFISLAYAMLRDDSLEFTRCDSGVDCRWGQVRVYVMITSI